MFASELSVPAYLRSHLPGPIPCVPSDSRLLTFFDLHRFRVSKDTSLRSSKKVFPVAGFGFLLFGFMAFSPRLLSSCLVEFLVLRKPRSPSIGLTSNDAFRRLRKSDVSTSEPAVLSALRKAAVEEVVQLKTKLRDARKWCRGCSRFGIVTLHQCAPCLQTRNAKEINQFLLVPLGYVKALRRKVALEIN